MNTYFCRYGQTGSPFSGNIKFTMHYTQWREHHGFFWIIRDRFMLDCQVGNGRIWIFIDIAFFLETSGFSVNYAIVAHLWNPRNFEWWTREGVDNLSISMLTLIGSWGSQCGHFVEVLWINSTNLREGFVTAIWSEVSRESVELYKGWTSMEYQLIYYVMYSIQVGVVVVYMMPFTDVTCLLFCQMAVPRPQCPKWRKY